MKTNRLTAFLAVAGFAIAVSAAEARQGTTQGPVQPSQAKPEAKPDAAPTLAGKWSVNVETPNGAVESALDLKVDGKKVAGVISSQMGEAKIEGELADGKLTFWFTMDANGQTLSVTFTGAQQKDGSLAGTLNFGQGDMNWTAVRAKN